jgi:ion channel-forming bestrophin family protein
MLRGEAGVYYADLYPLISFLPRFSTPIERASEDDVMPLWRASAMDHMVHKNIRAETLSSGFLSRANSEPLPESMNENEKGSWSGPKRLKKAKTFDPEMALPVLPSEQPLLPARSPPHNTLYDYFGFLRIFKAIFKPFSRRLSQLHADPTTPTSTRCRTITGKKIKPEAADSNVPVEIALYLTTYFASLMRQGLLTPASATAMNNAITTLQDTVFNLERIKSTPLPFAYQAHLRISLWYVPRNDTTSFQSSYC